MSERSGFEQRLSLATLGVADLAWNPGFTIHDDRSIEMPQ